MLLACFQVLEFVKLLPKQCLCLHEVQILMRKIDNKKVNMSGEQQL